MVNWKAWDYGVPAMSPFKLYFYGLITRQEYLDIEEAQEQVRKQNIQPVKAGED